LKEIIKVVSVEKKWSKFHSAFYLNTVILDDDETYTIPHYKPSEIGDEVEAWYSEVWDKPCGRYPKHVDKPLHNRSVSDRIKT